MTTFTVTVKDQAVLDVLQQLQRRMGNLQPALQAIGDDMVERTKRRFDTSTAPDGSGWKPNSAATLGLFVGGFGKSNFKKDGGLNAKGHKVLANKRPLIGESLDLSRQIFAKSNSNQLTVSSSPAYGAIHQFGGQAGRGHKVTIPARPFMAIQANSELYPNEQKMVLDSLQEFLTGDL